MQSNQKHRVTILTSNPTVLPLAEMALNEEAVLQMAEWVKSHRPDCVPPGGFGSMFDLLPHGREEEAEHLCGSCGGNGRHTDPGSGRSSACDDCNGRGAIRLRPTEILTDNELLVEFAGRKCYDSFAEKAGRKTNHEYIAHTQSGDVPHASIMYHAKFTFFVAGISRRVSQEIFRHYVGADRNDEGSPSQESTRFTHHYGWFVAPPAIAEDPHELRIFTSEVQDSYDDYTAYIDRQVVKFVSEHARSPTGMDRKRIYEAAAAKLHWSAETSFIWTTNPAALAKMFKERDNNAADREFQGLARTWKALSYERWPNLFPHKR